MPIIFILILILANQGHVFADNLIATSSATITANVPANQGPTSGDTTAPTVPILIRPTDGSYTADNRPEFVWLQSTDSNSNWLAYHLYLNGVATFLGINNYGNSSGTGYTARLESDLLRLIPAYNLADGNYDWRIVAYDASGNERGSATWHLTIDTQTPTVTLLQLGSYNQPNLNQQNSYDLNGPGMIEFEIGSEPYVEISLILYNELTGETITLQGNTQEGTNIKFYPSLNLGSYQVLISAHDLAQNNAILPNFTLNLISSFVPGNETPQATIFPTIITQNIPALDTLPATLMFATTRVKQAVNYAYILAIPIIILLIPRRKTNIKLLTKQDRDPLVGYCLTDEFGNKATTNHNGEAYLPSLHSHSYLILTYKDTTPLTLCLIDIDSELFVLLLN